MQIGSSLTLEIIRVEIRSNFSNPIERSNTDIYSPCSTVSHSPSHQGHLVPNPLGQPCHSFPAPVGHPQYCLPGPLGRKYYFVPGPLGRQHNPMAGFTSRCYHGIQRCPYSPCNSAPCPASHYHCIPLKFVPCPSDKIWDSGLACLVVVDVGMRCNNSGIRANLKLVCLK